MKKELIFNKTEGHCHFCGDKIVLSKYGKGAKSGCWEADHVVQKFKGGPSGSVNCLPACTRCNRLRWHRTSKEIQDILFLGVITKKEIKNKTIIGKMLLKLKQKRLKDNKKRCLKKVIN